MLDTEGMPIPMIKIPSISVRTAQRWLAKYGWIYARNKKGYTDGHEREDVGQYRDQVNLR